MALLALGSVFALGCGDLEVELPEIDLDGGTGDEPEAMGESMSDSGGSGSDDESGGSEGDESGGSDDSAGSEDSGGISGTDGDSDEGSDGPECELPLPEGEETFEVTGEVVTFVVPPCIQWLTIEAGGARGGDNFAIEAEGGLGALMVGSFAVQPGEELSIVVGEHGFDATEGDLSSGGGGGGGGSFVWRAQSKELLIAAGGGGGSAPLGAGEPHFFGQDGVIIEDGTGSRSDDVFGDSPGGTDGWRWTGGLRIGRPRLGIDPRGPVRPRRVRVRWRRGLWRRWRLGLRTQSLRTRKHGGRRRWLLGWRRRRFLRLLRGRRRRIVQQRRQAGQRPREDRGRRLRDDHVVSLAITARAGAGPRRAPDTSGTRDRGTS